MNIVKCIDLVMLYFVSLFKVVLLLWTLLVVPISTDKREKTTSEAGMVINFIEKIIKPYVEDNHNSVNHKSKPRTTENKIRTEITHVIRIKVAQLKPMLQDCKNHKNTKIETESLSLEGNDKTVILEKPDKIRRTKVKLAVKESKSSSDTFQKKIENYKQIRKHITLLLDKENTSNFTNKLITTTLDEMLDLLIKKQCKWKSVYTGDLAKHLDKNSRRSMIKLRNKGKTLDQYRLACSLVPKHKDAEKNHHFRHDDSRIKESDQNPCGTFIICSSELKDFLKITYNYLNDTAVATFRNYAAMYTRDVLKTTKPVYDIVTSELDYLSNLAESQVSKIFINELQNFTLDENRSKTANIQHLKNFITVTTSQITNKLKTLVDKELNAMNIKNKIFSTIKEDLTVNLRVEMGNLNQIMSEKICRFFVLCNGIGTRRFNKPGEFKPKDIDNVYFKVRLRFDDELKSALARFGNQNNMNPLQGDVTSMYSFGKSLMDKSVRRYNYANVTRTTVGSTATTESIASSETLLEQFF